MAEVTLTTVRVHSYVDPACRYNRGLDAARWMMFFYRCDECHRLRRMDPNVTE